MTKIRSYENRKKRQKTIILSVEAIKVLNEERRKNKDFDFSKWISKQLIKEFIVDIEQRALNELIEVQDEMTKVNKEYEFKVSEAVKKLQEAKEEKQRRSIMGGL